MLPGSQRLDFSLVGLLARRRLHLASPIGRAEPQPCTTQRVTLLALRRSGRDRMHVSLRPSSRAGVCRDLKHAALSVRTDGLTLFHNQRLMHDLESGRRRAARPKRAAEQLHAQKWVGSERVPVG